MTKRRKKSYNPVNTMVFVIVGAVLIVFTDLIVLDGQKNISWFDNVVTRWMNKDETSIKVSSLRRQHQFYLDGGVEVPEAYASSNLPPSDFSDADVEVLDFASSSLIPLEDVIEQERLSALSAIQPAAGHNLGVVLDEQRDEDVFAQKNVLDVISDLNIQEVAKDEIVAAELDIVPEIEVIEAVEVLPSSQDYTSPSGGGQIAIIIDDMGLTLRSKQVEAMKGPLTLAYLPYADGLKVRTQRALKNGHELMVHIPMEAMNTKLDGGPKVLKSSLNVDEFDKTLMWGLDQFEGYVGVNNHMGSRLTQDVDAMRRVMAALKKRGVFFVDSKTIGSSVAADTARDIGIPYAERDVFLDHEISMDFVRKALRKLEQVAQRKGSAIAIGHPHKETIAALKEWLPTLTSKGLTLVPASALVHQPVDRDVAASGG